MYESFLNTVLSWFPNTPFYATLAQIFVVLAVLMVFAVSITVVSSVYSRVRHTIRQRRAAAREHREHGDDGPTGRRW